MVLPLADIAELVSSEYFLSGALIIGGMLIGAYGQAGKFPVITAFGIFCVMAGAVEQFTTVAGKSEGVSDRILTTIGFLGAVLIGVFALGLGLRHRDSALGGLSLVIGVLVLAGCAAALFMAVFFINGPLGSFD